MFGEGVSLQTKTRVISLMIADKPSNVVRFDVCIRKRLDGFILLHLTFAVAQGSMVASLLAFPSEAW